MRVRQFELRLLAVVLSLLWALGGLMALAAYRPGGPVDVFVGLAALLPTPVAVAAIVWPPLVRSDRGAASVFWIGFVAGLLLMPALYELAGQILQAGTQPLLPSLEVVYPWAIALFATAFFSGLGLSRQLITEVGFGRRRLAASVGFALVTTFAIGGVFAGVSLADNAALSNRPGANSPYGPTSDRLPPQCNAPIATAGAATVDLDLWGDVDTRSIGTVALTGVRSGTDVSWKAQVSRGDVFREHGLVMLGKGAWTLGTDGHWSYVDPGDYQGYLVDLTALANALTARNRATAEDRGFEYAEAARARRCRIAVDGPTFLATFPEVGWLTGQANVKAWRGQLDYWIFADGEVGRVEGFVNGAAGILDPHGLLATVNVKMSATYRDSPKLIKAP